MFPGAAMLPPAQAAEALGVSDRHIINAIEEGKLIAINAGLGTRKRWRIPISTLAIFQEENAKK